MKRLSLRLFVFGVAAVSAAAVLAGGDQDTVTLNQISGYRAWTKMNPEPVKVETPINSVPSSDVA